MKVTTRLFLSVFLFLCCFSTFALEKSQAQDIRFNKAKIHIHQGSTKEAFLLLNQNLKGPFHLDTVYFLVEYYYEKKQYLKSYRYLRVLANNALSPELKKIKFTPSNKEEYLNRIRKISPLKTSDYSILQYVSNKLYDFYLKKSISSEYLPFILSLAQKYLLICYAHDHRIIDTNYALSKIAVTRNDIPNAIFYILEAYEKLHSKQEIEHVVSSTELQTVLAEILIKDGLAETGALIMRSASLDKNISPELREYLQTYSDTIKKAFFNVIYDYQLKMKSNILQVSDLEESLGAQNTSALNHHNHFNIYYQTQLNRKYSLIGGMDIVNESSLSSSVSEANFTSISTDLKLKKYKSGNTLSSFNARFDILSGRDLPSLTQIQERSQQVFSYERFWLTPHGKWQYVLPFYMKQYSQRNSMALASGVVYESFNSSRWWRLKYQGNMGLQLEGESLGTTLFLDLNISNQSKISKKMNLQSLFSLYKQFNSNDFLNYQQMAFGFYLDYIPSGWKSATLFSSLEFKNRSFTNDTTYQMLDLNIGFKYNF